MKVIYDALRSVRLNFASKENCILSYKYGSKKHQNGSNKLGLSFCGGGGGSAGWSTALVVVCGGSVDCSTALVLVVVVVRPGRMLLWW